MKDINGNYSILKEIEKQCGKSIKYIKTEGHYQTITEIGFYDYNSNHSKASEGKRTDELL